MYMYMYMYMITRKLMTHCLKVNMFQPLPSHNYKYKVNFLFLEVLNIDN